VSGTGNRVLGGTRLRFRRGSSSVGVANAPFAAELATAFVESRRGRHTLFPDVIGALAQLRSAGHPLAVLTNGSSDRQRDKLSATGLEQLFDVVVISGEVGLGKPDPRIFRRALAELGACPSDATMVGDNRAKDVDAARAVGLRAIWLNRDRHEATDHEGCYTACSLDEALVGGNVHRE